MNIRSAVCTSATDDHAFILGAAVAKVRRRTTPFGTSQGTATRI
jgi:hypothetical protein